MGWALVGLCMENNNPFKRFEQNEKESLVEIVNSEDRTEESLEALYNDINKLEEYVATNTNPNQREMERMAERIMSNLTKLDHKSGSEDAVEQVGQVVTAMADQFPNLKDTLQELHPALQEKYGLELN